MTYRITISLEYVTNGNVETVSMNKAHVPDNLWSEMVVEQTFNRILTFAREEVRKLRRKEK